MEDKEEDTKINSNQRPNWDQYFMQMAKLTAKRSTCMRRFVGAVLVKNRKILATGYNGPPKGIMHCSEKGGCERAKQNIPSGQRDEICRAVHAEQNCIIQSAYHGIATEGSVLYCTTFPCVICAKMLINAGVKEIVYDGEYQSELSMDILNDSHVKVRRYNGPLE